MKKHARWLAWTVVICLGFASRGVLADGADKREAGAHFKAGEALFDKGEFLKAAEEFQKAYELSPFPQVLYNLATCFDQGGKADLAVKSYRRYLAEAKVDPSEFVTIRRRLSELESMVSDIRIACAVANCQIRLDGAELGNAPVSMVLLPGQHEVEASVQGRVAAIVQVALKPGEDKSLVLDVVGAPPPRVDKKKRLGWPFWVAGGTAVASGAALVVFGLKTNQAEEDFVASGRTDKALHDDGVRDKLISNVLIGVTGGAAAVAIAFLIYDLRGSTETAQKKSEAKVRLVPMPGLGLAAVGEF